MRVVGLISGTSMDGIDVAVAELRTDESGLVLTPLGALELPYPAALRDELLAALPPGPCTAGQLTRLDTCVGQAFAQAAHTALDRFGPADLVASLGQTVFHWIEDGQALGTLQLGQPAWIAERTGLPVVADLRVRDIAAGGHGAPLAGTLDALWLRGVAEDEGAPAAALNIGGIANLTVVHPGGDVLAYDTGPGNALLDAAVGELTGGARRSDTGGALAARGSVRPDLLDRLLADPYYAAAPPKSTGKEHFHTGYLRDAVAGLPAIADEDLLATLTELTAATIAHECERHGVRTVVASGGGIRNPVLLRALAARLTVVPSDELGLPADAKEAYLTALLGWLTWHGVPANVPSATGARGPRLLGSITPGSGPLELPSPLRTVPRRLRVAKTAETR
ncbi:anhydro-N-acetylmuramic acid kinase [Prauserella endophytica]|uniref:Anhydro-N-acetylmuramic acid kinase n=1 Tax=Prauserella endophytica TaxID=1592324 RepID=A0ABY2S618_9PSEU|nr:anhydro-N-acetylmuramic acid kinase [Prauserella endophytica]TKG71330.1 anhydro-N-acetylmuramic acid kinase [Prauserella endophytica]